MLKEKLSFRVYEHKKTGEFFPLTEDESEIDLKNPLTDFDKKKYKLTGENNHFKVYELKKVN